MGRLASWHYCDQLTAFILARALSEYQANILKQTLSEESEKRIRTAREFMDGLRSDRPTVSAVGKADRDEVATPAVRSDNPPGYELVWVPPGTFDMGSPPGEPGRWNDEGPVHTVTFESGFYLGKCPVTNEQYAKFLRANPSARKPEYWTDERFNHAQQPVVGVSWEEAQQFCEWAGLLLPSEAQWEYACRAGMTTVQNFGDDASKLVDHGWYFVNSGKQVLPTDTEWDSSQVMGEWGCRSRPVGKKKSNPWDLYDMHGNVWEWCQDHWHGSYHGAPSDGRAWCDKRARTGDRVLRGGSWFGSAGRCRSASRYFWPPGDRFDDVGFRSARSIEP